MSVEGFNAESTFSGGAMGAAWYLHGKLAWDPTAEGLQEAVPWLVVIGCVCVLGSILGGVVGAVLPGNRRPPVELSRYSRRHGTLAVRFRRPDYAAKFAAAVQSPE